MPYALPHIERMAAYPVGAMPADPERELKLNQNESPYPPSPKVLETMHTFGTRCFHRYPGAGPAMLRKALAERYGLPQEAVFLANGSSEIISLLMKVFLGPGGTVALPDPTFELYHTAAALQQAVALRIPTGPDYAIHIDAMLESGADAIVLVNPNSPTGRLLSRQEVERLAAGFSGLVVVDEAYMDYATTDASVIALTSKQPNLLVLRTFSKAYGLSGIRVGYALGHAGLITALEKGRDLYSVNELSARLALAALEDESDLQKKVRALIRTRNTFSQALQELGYAVAPSETNFLLCAPPVGGAAPEAALLSRLLQERGIYVRYFPHPRVADRLRITIGTDAEMARLLAALRQLA